MPEIKHTSHEFQGADMPVEEALKRLSEIASTFLEDRGLTIAARQHPVHGPIIKDLHRKAVLLAFDNSEPGVDPSEAQLEAMGEIPLIMGEMHKQYSEYMRDLVVELGGVLSVIPPNVLMQLTNEPVTEKEAELIAQVEKIEDGLTAGTFKVHPDLAAIMAVATACAGGQENFLKIQMDITRQIQGKIPDDAHPASKVISIMTSTVLNAISLRTVRPQFIAVDQRLIIELVDMSKSLAGFGFTGQWDLNAEQLAKKYFNKSVNHMTSNLPSDKGSVAHDMLGDIPFSEDVEEAPGFLAVGGADAELEPAHKLKVQGSGNGTMFSGNKTVN